MIPIINTFMGLGGAPFIMWWLFGERQRKQDILGDTGGGVLV